MKLTKEQEAALTRLHSEPSISKIYFDQEFYEGLQEADIDLLYVNTSQIDANIKLLFSATLRMSGDLVDIHLVGHPKKSS